MDDVALKAGIAVAGGALGGAAAWGATRAEVARLRRDVDATATACEATRTRVGDLERVAAKGEAEFFALARRVDDHAAAVDRLRTDVAARLDKLGDKLDALLARG